MQLIINKYLSKSNQNLVHYLSHQAVKRTVCVLISGLATCLKALVLVSGLMALASASKVQPWPWP